MRTNPLTPDSLADLAQGNRIRSQMTASYEEIKQFIRINLKSTP